MRVQLCSDDVALGAEVAREAARLLREAVQRQGTARLLLSTGRSQFTTLAALVREAVPWKAVEAFHLDEYIGLGPEHPASFRRYLRERFSSRVDLGAMHEVAPEGDLAAALARLEAELRLAPVDVALVGVGENGHIAFNDPPADFETDESYITVSLAPSCRRQQVGEGWFRGVEEVPERAVTMTVRRVMASRAILSAVPYAVKAEAVRSLLQGEVTPQVPASILRWHPQAVLYLDRESSALVDPRVLARHRREADQG